MGYTDQGDGLNNKIAHRSCIHNDILTGCPMKFFDHVLLNNQSSITPHFEAVY